MGNAGGLLEREAELGTIDAAIEAAVGGNGRALLIEGEAGVGKTSLLAEGRRTAAGEGVEVLSARAGELERDFPFAVVRQLLGPPLRQASAEEREALFDGAVPARGALGLATGGDETSADTFSVLHALYWVAAALAERAPLMLTVDDAHLADAASLDWLGFMLPRLGELPIALVLARRTDEAERPGLTRLIGDESVRAIRPEPLSGEATAALIEASLRQQTDRSFADVCHEITGGNPFLVTELGRELAAQGIIPRAESSESARELAPRRVGQTVLARISRLSGETSALARAVAILGDGCEQPLAFRLAGLDLEVGRRSADALRAAAIFDPDVALRFNHPLVRNAVYADLTTGERGAAHATAADLLRESGASPERVAVQLLAGEPREDVTAAETLYEAGRRSLADGAPSSAVSFLTRALQELPPAELRLEILRQLLEGTVHAADHEVFAAIEPEVMAAIDRDPAGTRDLAIRLPVGMMLVGRFEEAARILSGAVRAAAEEGDIENAFRLDAALRTVGMAFPAVEEVDLQRYLDLIEPDSPTARLAAAVEARAAVLDESRAAAVEAAKRALGNNCVLFEEEAEMIAATGSTLILLITDEMQAASRAADRALEIARRRNAMPEIGRGWFLSGLISWGYGDLVAAESAIRQAREIALLATITPLWFTCTGPLALLLIYRDELDAAEATLAEIGVGADPVPSGALFLLPLMARAKLRFERGEYEACLEDVTALTSQSEGFGGGTSPALMLAVEEIRVLVAMDRNEEARARADELVAIGRGWGAPTTVSHLIRAAAAAAGGDEEVEMLRESVAVMTESPRRLQLAEALVALGAALRRQNQRAAARDPLREGLKIARQCGAVRLAKQAQEELRATGETVRRYAPIGVESLTPSERRVADMAATGLTNRQIAQSLFVTLKTVEAHLSATYDKLDISSRRELPGALAGAPSAD